MSVRSSGEDGQVEHPAHAVVGQPHSPGGVHDEYPFREAAEDRLEIERLVTELTVSAVQAVAQRGEVSHRAPSNRPRRTMCDTASQSSTAARRRKARRNSKAGSR